MEQTDRKLHTVRKALRYWDPIGVIEDRDEGKGTGDDEYDSYAARLLRSIESGDDCSQIALQLAWLRHVSI